MIDDDQYYISGYADGFAIRTSRVEFFVMATDELKDLYRMGYEDGVGDKVDSLTVNSPSTFPTSSTQTTNNKRLQTPRPTILNRLRPFCP